MKITAIIPLYNSERYIKESVQSILDQTYQDFELILVNDSSTDKTAVIANQYALQYKNITVTNNKYQKGISGAINTGLDLAHGELIANLDHDDLSLSTRFEKQAKFLQAHPEIGACGSWMQEFEGGTNIWSFPAENNELKAITLLHSPIANPTAMIRKSILDKHNIRYKSEYDVAQDYEFWVQLLPLTQFANIPEVLVKYRVHSDSASESLMEKQFEAWRKALTPLIINMGLIPDDFLFNTIFEMKYPNFYKEYKDQRNEIDQLIESIIQANNKTNVFPQEALKRLFTTKRDLWNSRILETTV